VVIYTIKNSYYAKKIRNLMKNVNYLLLFLKTDSFVQKTSLIIQVKIC